jgi:hypothetical protein
MPEPERQQKRALDPGGGEEGISPVLSIQEKDTSRRTSSPPLPARPREDPDRRIEMARLLKGCGVKFYAQIARQYPSDLIEARVAEWEEDGSLGPGMLVKMIQQGGPIMEALPKDSTPPARSTCELLAVPTLRQVVIVHGGWRETSAGGL